jgi:hypothetical protein
METLSVIQELFKVLFPKEIALHFEIKEVQEHKNRITIRMEELPELVPSELQDSKEVVLDGFCNPVELQSFPLKGKPVYLELYRRRWKSNDDNKRHSNTYKLHPEGVKATADFAAFLKDTFGYTPDEYNNYISVIMR